MEEVERQPEQARGNRYPWQVPAFLLTLAAGLAIAVLHYWVLRHTQERLNREVARQSNGKFLLELGSARFNYWSLTLTIEDSRLEIYDSLHRTELAGLEVPRISLHFKSMVRFLVNRELILDTVVCNMPSLTIQPAKRREELTLSVTLGKAALALRQAAENLNIGFLVIREGKLTVRPSRAGLFSVRISDLNVAVDNFSADSSSVFRLLNTDDIRLQSRKQRVVFADSLNVISFKEIRLSTREGAVYLDSCSIEGHRPGNLKSAYRFFFKRIRLTQIDYAALYERNFIKADSLMAYNPEFQLRLELPTGPQRMVTERLTEETLKVLLGNLDVNYVGLQNIQFDLTSKRGSISESYSTRGNNVRLFGLFVDQGSDRPIQLERVAFEFANYRRLSADSMYRESFDSVLISNRDLVLLNYQYVPSEFHQRAEKRWIRVPRLILKNIALTTLLFERKIKANTIDLKNPFIRISGGGVGPLRADDVFFALDTLRQTVGVERAVISGGRVEVDGNDQDAVSLSISGLSSDVLLDDLFGASTVEGLELAVASVRCNSLKFESGHVAATLNEVLYSARDRTLHAKTSDFAFGAVRGNVSEISAGPLLYTDEEIRGVSHLSWSGGAIQFGAFAIDSLTGRSLSVDQFRIRNSAVELGDDSSGRNSVWLDELNIDSLQFEMGHLAKSKLILAAGGKLSLRSGQEGSRTSIGQFLARNGEASNVQSVEFRTSVAGARVAFTVPRIDFVPDFRMVNELPELDSVRVKSPKIEIHLVDPGSRGGEGPDLPRWSNIAFSDASLSILRNNTDTLFDAGSGDIAFSEVIGRSMTGRIQVRFPQGRFNLGPGLNWNVREGISFAGSLLERDSAGPQRVSLEHLDLADVERAGSSAAKYDGGFDGLRARISNTTLLLPLPADWIGWILSEPSLELTSSYFRLPTQKATLTASDLRFANIDSSLELSSIRVTPNVSREQFVDQEPFQKDYVTLMGGPTAFHGLDLKALIRDSSIISRRTEIRQPWMEVYRDKRTPRKPGSYKALPTGLITSSPWRISLDTILLRDAAIRYTELSEKTLETGTVLFTNLDARLLDVDNGRHAATDSLRIDASALLMDTSLIRLNFRQAYADTLWPFTFSVGMGPYRLQGLNQAVEPLASFRITSGQAEKLQLRAAGNNYYTLGRVKFYYQDLGVEFLPADPRGGSLFTGLSNFFTNSFIINRNNARREGVVYFQRDREKSVFNYWLKITLSGILTSVGVKTNKSYMRNYRRNLKKYRLPEPMD